MEAIISNLRDAADAMSKSINKKLNPAIAQQNHTSRRARIAAGMFDDGVALQRIQRACYLVADGLQQETLPYVMRSISTKKQIQLILRYENWDDNVEVFEPMLDLFQCNDHYRAARDFLLASIDDEATNAERARRELIVKEMSLISVVPGYYPTPFKVVERMFKEWPINPSTAFDPTAGGGMLLDGVRELFPHCQTSGTEINYTLAEIARIKGHAVNQGDIYDQVGQHDFIVANPPFEKNEDEKNEDEKIIRWVYDNLLSPGGRLIAVMAHNKITERSEELQALVDDHGDWCPLPPKSFEKSLTGVATMLVTLVK